MDNGRADIIAGIRELRAKAAEQLTGNDYYMIVQQFDSLAADAELSDDAARSMFSLVSAEAARRACRYPIGGGPEVPGRRTRPPSPIRPPPPRSRSSPSPAQPDKSPGPDIPSPPSSPAEPPTPSEIPTHRRHVRCVRRTHPDDQPESQLLRRGTSDGRRPLPRPEAPDEALPADAGPAARSASGLDGAVMAVRTLVEQNLSGNSYYAAANLLGQLQILPPAAEGGEITAPMGSRARWRCCATRPRI